MSFFDKIFGNSGKQADNAPDKGVKRKTTSLSRKEILALQAEGKKLQFVDVREAFERRGGHIPNDKNIPLASLPDQAAKQLEQNKLVLTYCVSGHRSGIAAQTLRQLGYDAYSVAGGFTEWVSSGGEFSVPR